MPVNFNIPFLPQQGQTEQVLAAIQLANSIRQHQAEMAIAQQQLGIQKQQLGLQQQAQPSEIAQRQATTEHTQAETKMLPQQFDLELKKVQADLDLRKAIEESNAQYKIGMLGIRQTDEQRKTIKDANDNAINSFKAMWQAKSDAAKIQGVQGGLALRQEALAQQKDLTQQSIALRAQANQLRAQGLDIQAENAETQADRVDNQVGVVRSIAGAFGMAPEVKTPSASTPNAPQSGITVKDPQGGVHTFPDQASANAFKKAAGIQ